jgi:uncharacterized protein (DUF486 family)
MENIDNERWPRFKPDLTGLQALIAKILRQICISSAFPPMRPELLKPTLLTVSLLAVSNVFMTFAWYGHLRTMQQSPWWAAALVSWSIALGEYLIMVPANRLGYAGGLSGAQLKILQECVTLAVFVPFMLLFLGEKWKWDYLWAFCCLLGAVFFIFRPDRG